MTNTLLEALVARARAFEDDAFALIDTPGATIEAPHAEWLAIREDIQQIMSGSTTPGERARLNYVFRSLNLIHTILFNVLASHH